MKNWMKSSFSEPIKNIKVKPIESYTQEKDTKLTDSFSKLYIGLIKKYLYNDRSFHKVWIGNSIKW